MSKLIIVCGLPGAGKTTLACELSRKTRIHCIHKDFIKENLCEFLDVSGLDDSKKIGLVSVKLMFSMIEEYLKNGVDLIVESPFNYKEDGGVSMV
ncbi:AAA family ATPase [Patescibacteria group bacterium]